MEIHDDAQMPPVIAALHLARSALTVANGRVALARRHAERGTDPVRVASDLAAVPDHLAQVAMAVDTLANAARACEVVLGPGFSAD
jgi:hypothetical protein